MQTPKKHKNKRSEEMDLFLASQNQEIKEQIKINLEQKKVFLFEIDLTYYSTIIKNSHKKSYGRKKQVKID